MKINLPCSQRSDYYPSAGNFYPQLMLLGLLFVPSHLLARDNQDENDVPLESVKVSVDDDRQEALPVEIGAGGVIMPEITHRTETESRFQWHGHVHWESRYVTEGRDNLQGNNLLSVSTEFALDEINFVPWFAYSAAADYTELDLNFFYGARLTEKLIAYLGYTHIRARYQEERESANEINFDLSYLWLEKLHVYSTIYHSFFTDGTFMEAILKSGHPLNKRVYLGAQFLIGVNAGYRPNGHDGFNHFQLRTNVAYQPRAKMEVYAYVAYNQAINRDPERYSGDESLKDFFWGGVGYSYRF